MSSSFYPDGIGPEYYYHQGAWGTNDPALANITDGSTDTYMECYDLPYNGWSDWLELTTSTPQNCNQTQFYCRLGSWRVTGCQIRVKSGGSFDIVYSGNPNDYCIGYNQTGLIDIAFSARVASEVGIRFYNSDLGNHWHVWLYYVVFVNPYGVSHKDWLTGIKHRYIPGSFTEELYFGGVSTEFNLALTPLPKTAPETPYQPPPEEPIIRPKFWEMTDVPEQPVIPTFVEPMTSHHHYTCPFCGAMFTTTTLLLEHIEAIHGGL